MPDRSTLRKNYVSTIYEETLLKIRGLIKIVLFGFLLMNLLTLKAGIFRMLL